MKTMIRLLTVTATTLLLFALIGCNGSAGNKNSSEDKTNCVIIYSQHMNSKAWDPQGQASAITEYLVRVKKSEGYLAFVKLDGNPSVVWGDSITNESKNERKLEKETEEFVETMSGFKDIKAEAEEVDILGSLKIANDSLAKATDDAYENVVVVIGTGLSTSGVIDFSSTGLQSLDLNDYRDWIERTGQLPKLDRIDKIVWYGFDAVDKPQEEFPTEAKKQSLMEFYKLLLQSAGVENIVFEDGATEFKSIASNTVDSSSNLPSVSVVAMPSKPKYSAGGTKELDADILFNPDEATFLDGTDPMQNEDIIEIADSIQMNKLKVTITGYTAHYDTTKGCEELSLDRAEAMKDVLVKLGCPESSITTVGGGWGPYENDVENADQKNRCVKFEFK